MSFKSSTWSVRLLRHATLLIETDDTRILVDPMFSPKGAMDPVPNAGNDIRIPMVDLPIKDDQLASILSEVDMVLVTHTHRDHWDAAAHKLIDKSKPIFCQPDDLGKIKGAGFMHVYAIEDKTQFNSLTIHRTNGKHGTADIGEKMGIVSGFVIKEGVKSLYIAGDTIWCADVKNAIDEHHPQMIVVNSGGARFNTGDPITMDAGDVMTTSRVSPGSTVVAVHMDTVNHCKVTRDILKKFVTSHNLRNVRIPADGETLSF
jgi:L-ascorbate metabolism protein UlaG (beta-lactamase superfamily)